MPNSSHTLEDKYAIGVKIAGLGLGFIDYIENTIIFDERAAALFDLLPDTALTRDQVHARIHPEDRATLNAHVKRLLDHDEGDDFFELNHRIVHANGNILSLTVRKQVEFSPEDAEGNRVPSTGLVAIIDITEHRTNQERVQYLLDELNHRVKNLLAVVQGIARLTFSSGDASSAKDRFAKRLGGLTHNLDALVQGNWDFADLGNLVAAHLAGFTTTTSQIEMTGPTVALNPEQAQAIGMAMHELATNAFKYGALSVADGKVAVAWEVNGDNLLTLEWTETGGPEVVPPKQAGFGSKVINDMAASTLRGEVQIEYRPEGLYWNVQFPLSKVG